ncbi:hypothetical protein OsI_33635 [Oryza sativa Indica Group]|uniref:Uncharacterized protein n=1 Tax=Oryza sativa subsp. indica TaxID=39946 RepID=A2Z7F5_ORYSI|nr:hypothetical protein OsI_33635 [Oryza sativa Indica Group]
MGGACAGEQPAQDMVVFAFLDVVDVLLCFVYGFLYSVFEDNPASCYCHGSHNARHWRTTRYHWRSAWPTRADGARQGRSGSPETERRKGRSPRWSDCGCESCRT